MVLKDKDLTQINKEFAWLAAFRRLIVRYENHINRFVVFLELGFSTTTLRKCL